MQDINSVSLVARLVRDPELRSTAGGTSVASMRVAFNKSVKDPATGEWSDKGCFINVSAFGGQAESCCKVLTKGRQVVIKGRLDSREWEQDGAKRSEVSIVAEQVQFIGDRPQQNGAPAPARAAAPAQTQATAAPADDDDCPF